MDTKKNTLVTLVTLPFWKMSKVWERVYLAGLFTGPLIGGATAGLRREPEMIPAATVVGVLCGVAWAIVVPTLGAYWIATKYGDTSDRSSCARVHH